MKQESCEKNKKKEYVKPQVRSQKVLEKAALTCSGTFNNPYTNLKSSYYSCGFNDS